MEREAEDCRRKENRKIAKVAEKEKVIGRDEKDHQAKVNGKSQGSNISSLTREVYDTGGGKAENQELAQVEIQGGPFCPR